MSNVQIGLPWLTAAEIVRASRLAGLRQVFEGRHSEYFYAANRTQHVYKAIGPNSANVLYITENLAGRCTLKFADLLFGEALTIDPADAANVGLDEAIDRLDESSGLQALLYGGAVEASWAGEAWVQPIVAAGQVRLEAAAPESVFPRFDTSGQRLIGATIKYELELPGAPGERYVRVIDHLPGRIEHELWRLARGSMRVEARVELAAGAPGVADVEATGLAAPAIVRLPNYSTGGLAASDYDGECLTLIDEINNRRSQISRILDLHADPAVQALESLFDEHGNLKLSGRAIMVDDASVEAVKYVTWNGELGAAANGLVSARDAFLGHMEIAPQLVGLGAGTSADSWKKYKLASSQTLARVNRKRLFLAPAVKGLVAMACELENRFAPGVSYAVTPLSLTWSDGLPGDEEEQMRLTTGYHGAGLLSDYRALMWIHNGDADVVADELARLEAQRERDLPTSFRDGNLNLAGNE